MKFHFDPNQQYQIDAVKSIVDIFEGQPLNQGDFGFSVSENGQLFTENGVGYPENVHMQCLLTLTKNIKIAELCTRVDGGKQPMTLRGKVFGRHHSAWSA